MFYVTVVVDGQVVQIVAMPTTSEIRDYFPELPQAKRQSLVGNGKAVYEGTVYQMFHLPKGSVGLLVGRN